MIITLSGENNFAVHQALAQLQASFIAKRGSQGIEKVDAEEIVPGDLFSLFMGASLFAQHRFVVLKNAAKNKAVWEVLADWVQKVPSETTVVIVEPALDKRTKTYKALKAHSNFNEYAYLGEAQLVAWLVELVKNLGGTVSNAIAQYWVQRTGGDQWQLAKDAEKLVAYASQVTKEGINLLVEPTPEGSAFELLDCALAGDQKRAAFLIDQLKVSEDPYKLFGLLAAQVHVLAVVSAAGTRSPDHIAKEAGLHPFVVRKTGAVAKRLGKQRIATIAKEVALCDLQLKSTGTDPWDLLRLCLQKIAT